MATSNRWRHTDEPGHRESRIATNATSSASSLGMHSARFVVLGHSNCGPSMPPSRCEGGAELPGHLRELIGSIK